MSLLFEVNPKSLPKADQVFSLMEKAGISFPEWTPERITRALENSSVVICVWDGEALVGFARAISDGAWSAYLNQIAVLPQFQKQGIGKQMLSLLIENLGEEVSLVAHSADSATGFYLAAGFEPRSNVFRLKRKR